MTTKQRVQVQGLGEAPSIKPVDLPGFQHSIAQRQAGTNKLLDLASGFQQLGKITTQYAGIRQQELTRDIELEKAQAAQFQEEQREQEKFDQVLLKQHLNTVTLPSLQQQAESLVDVQKYTKREQTSQAIDEAINKEWESLSKALGGDVADSLASKALWNSVVPGVKAKLMSQYEKNREDFVESAQGQDLMDQLRQATNTGAIDTVGLELLVERREKLMIEQGITDPATRQKILLNAYTAQADTLITKDRFKDSQAFITSMELMKVNGRRVFGSAESVKAINALTTKLEEAESKQGTVSKTTRQQRQAGLVRASLMGLHANDVYGGQLEEPQIDAIKESLINLSTDLANNPKELDKIVEEIIASPNSVSVYENKRLELAMNPESSDLAKDLELGNTTRLETIRKQVLEKPTLPINLEESYKREQEEEFTALAAEQVEEPLTLKKFLETKSYAPWPELKKLAIEAEERSAVIKSPYYRGLKSEIDRMIKNETILAYEDPDDEEKRKIEETYLGVTGTEFSMSATERMQAALRDAAPKDDSEIVQIISREKREERARWLRIVKAGKDSYNMRPETEVTSEGEVVERADPETPIKVIRTKTPAGFIDDPVAYPSLMRIKRGVPVDMIERSEIEADRQDMEQKKYYDQRRLSYYNFGLTRYSREEVKKIADDLGMDTDEVRLFGSFEESEIKLNEWTNILLKDEEGKKLTAEEEKIAEEYIDLGIRNIDDLLRFGVVQQDLILRPRKAL